MENTQKKFNWAAIKQKYSIFFVLIFLFIVCTIINSKVFLSVNNLLNISRQLSTTTIVAFGETILIISGMIDLSAGSVLALSGVLSVASYQSTESIIVAILVGILVGLFCNLINAVMVQTFKTPPFIATLSMMTMARGVALLYTKGQNILQLGDFVKIGQYNIDILVFFREDGNFITKSNGIPIPILFLILMALITGYILRNTKFGRSLYAVGGNEEAAVASGIRVGHIKYKAYLLNGFFVGLAGVIFMSRVNAGLPNGAIGFEFQALTAAIIGGTSFSGGIGTATGTLAGAFIVGFLDNIMVLIGVDSYLQQIIRGAIIALAVIYDIRAKNKRTKRSLVN